MICVVRVRRLSTAVPVRSSKTSPCSSLINGSATLGLAVRLRERLGCRGFGDHSSNLLQRWRRILWSLHLGMVYSVPNF